MTNYNFNTKTGIPITLDGDDKPAFYIDANDMSFIEKATELYRETKKLSKKAKAVEKDIDFTADENGVPKDVNKMVKVMNEQMDEIYKMLDDLLGEGTSDKVFKGRHNLGLLLNFLDFISKIITENRESTMGKYSKKVKGKGKGVM